MNSVFGIQSETFPSGKNTLYLVPSSKSLLVANITFVISLKYPLLRKSSHTSDPILSPADNEVSVLTFA
jgi:hypothetical protein